MHLYKNGAKGGTVYVDGSRNAQVLSLTDDSDQDRVKYSVGIKFPKTKKKIEIKFYLF